ncbi:hypothetical protein ACFXKX_00740 [Streptomyces scopuliridis]
MSMSMDGMGTDMDMGTDRTGLALWRRGPFALSVPPGAGSF